MTELQRRAVEGHGSTAAVAGDLGAERPRAAPPEELLARRLAEAEDLLPAALQAEEEPVHDLRVSLRRTRVLCRELSRAGARPAGVLGELAAGAAGLFRALGGIRDLDILRRELESLVGSGKLTGPTMDPLIARWLEDERKRLQLGLPDAVAFFRTELARFRQTPELDFPRAVGGSLPGQRRGLRRRARRFLKALRAARGEPVYERLHRLRIRGKQLRYTLEALELTSPGGGERLESGLKKVQDALGAIQDAAMVVDRFDALAAGGALPPAAAGPARVAVATERDRRRDDFVARLGAGEYDNLLDEVKAVAAKQRDGTNGGSNGSTDGFSAEDAEKDAITLENIPGIGAAKAKRLAEAGLATPEALKAASVDDLAAVKTIGPHQARLIKEFVDERSRSDGAGEEPDGKRFERRQSVLAVAAVVSDYAGTLAEELARQEEGDAVRAARQAERLAEGLKAIPERLDGISTKKLKGLRGELRQTEGLLAKVLDLDSSSLKMNKLRKALKAHRKGIDSYLV